MKKLCTSHPLNLPSLIIALLLISGCTNSTMPVLETAVVETETPQTSATQTLIPSTEIPINIPAPTLTLTSEPPNVYIFSAGNDKKIDLSYGPVAINFDGGSLADKNIPILLISPQNLGGYESASEALKSYGNNVGVMYPENYGNLLLEVHSGYFHNIPEPGEVLRKYFEYWGLSGDQYVQYKLAEVIGSKGTFFTSTDAVDIEVTGAVRLGPDEASELSAYPENVLDIVTRKNKYGFLALGNPEVFENIKTGGHEVMITFCGWGPNGEVSYYEYVVLLNVTELP